jgi:hypothetical protein
MWGGIIGIAFAIWFYTTAEKRGLPNFQWAVAGYLSFFVPNLAWSMLVAKPIVAGLHASNQAFKAGLINSSSILIGVGCALAVYRFLLMKATPKAQS